MAANIVDAFKKPLDSLIGKTGLKFNKGILKRIEKISKIVDKTKKGVYIFYTYFLLLIK